MEQSFHRRRSLLLRRHGKAFETTEASAEPAAPVRTDATSALPSEEQDKRRPSIGSDEWEQDEDLIAFILDESNAAPPLERKDRPVQIIETDELSDNANLSEDAEGVRHRGQGAQQRAVAALRSFVDRNTKAFSDIRLSSPEEPPRNLPIPRIYTQSFVEDFHLAGLEMVASKIERCDGRARCNSLWCTGCRTRFGAKNLGDMQRHIQKRYGTDEARIRENVLHLTILNELVIPDPEIRTFKQAGRSIDFSASTVKRDHIDILNGLIREQKRQLKVMEGILNRKNLRREYFLDMDRDRSSPRVENFWHDVNCLIALNTDIDTARRMFKGKKRIELPSGNFPRPKDDGTDPLYHESFYRYLSQLQKSQKLSEQEFHKVALALQWIYRDFRTINRTKFPEYLKLKSSVEKVIKRERDKLYYLLRDLPKVSIIGSFEIELIDLFHAFDSADLHPAKAETLRKLAGQKRKRDVRPADRLIDDEMSSAMVKSRLLDNLRTQIHNGEKIDFREYPELRYSVLLHIHAMVDLNGTSRDDFEKWLSGKGRSARRFKPKWPLPRQTMLTSLHENREVGRSITSIGFYPFKSALGFNYNLAENRSADPGFQRESKSFSEEELAILVWLQQSLGFPGIAVRLNAASDYETIEIPKVGRKKTRSAMSVIPAMDQFQRDLHRMLDERGELSAYLENVGAEEHHRDRSSEMDASLDALFQSSPDEGKTSPIEKMEFIDTQQNSDSLGSEEIIIQSIPEVDMEEIDDQDSDEAASYQDLIVDIEPYRDPFASGDQ
ncbi:hypothetical protein [Microvirga terrestris]|uniref:Uncharacterized protein n=1 Tax=Microvirga terrestris TaxID=2791024 RepID=A0ABS0HVH4_9HYPH|nr:hypothetical protein [Microvirga terrestris]MBF9197150.1 hypothetical protein [Microvirga terrestris]